MSREIPDANSYQAKRKKESMEKLTERYYGKKDLLAEWDLYPDLDRSYRNDLKRRVHGHEQDIIYRGGTP